MGNASYLHIIPLFNTSLFVLESTSLLNIMFSLIVLPVHVLSAFQALALSCTLYASFSDFICSLGKESKQI